MARRRRNHKPQNIWRQRALSYRAELSRRLCEQEDDNIMATLAVMALRRLLDGRPLEEGDLKKAMHAADDTVDEIARVRAIIERNALSTALALMRKAMTNSGRTPWTEEGQSPEFSAVSDFYRSRMIGPWRKAFGGPLGDDEPLGMASVLE